MLAYLLPIATLFVSSGDAAQPSTATAEMGRLAADVCWRIESRTMDVPAGTDIDGLDAFIENIGLEPGIDGKMLDRLGPGSGLISRATMGSKSIGEDTLILAFGGQAPGCSVLLITPDSESREYALVDAFVQAGWREPRPGVAQQRGFIGKRMLVRRDDAGQPYLVNILTVMKPDSRWRHGITIVAIPPHVTLPEGF